METVAAICAFALGRGVVLPPTVFPADDQQQVAALEKLRIDPSVPTLARKRTSLDIFTPLGILGGVDHFARMRAAFLTFAAAGEQQHDSVSCILYVVAGESLTTHDAPWRNTKLTKRFVDFFDELMPTRLDELVAHNNFESVFGIRRGTRNSRALRRELLQQIYDFRSGHLHEGLRPAYRGIAVGFGAFDDVRRGIFADFAEGAILGYLESPRASLLGHPLYTSL